MVVIGAFVLAGDEAARTFQVVWPVVLIGIGVIVLVAAMRRSGTGSAGGGAT